MAVIRCGHLLWTNIKAVFLDKDGTLADSQAFLTKLAQARFQCLQRQVPELSVSLLAAWGVQSQGLDPAGLMAIGSRQENQVAAAAWIAATGKPWVEALAITKAAFVMADRQVGSKAKQTPPLPEAVVLLQNLIACAGVKLAILSSDLTAHVQEFAHQYGFESSFQLLMGGDQGLTKPDPRLFQKACDELAVSPEEALMIGDSSADLAMARAANAAAAIGVSWGWSVPLHLPEADVLLHRGSQLELLETLLPND